MSVKNKVTVLRYDVSFKVVWRFVRDLLQGNSTLLLSFNPEIEIRAVFAEPMDHIGIAEHNLLTELGFYRRKINTEVIFPQAISTHQLNDDREDEQVNVNGSVADLLEKLSNMRLNKNKIIALINQLPDKISSECQERFITIFGHLLSSWWYRIKGAAAYKLARSNVKIPEEYIEKLEQIARDKNCHSYQRHAALLAMTKIKLEKYDRLCDIYLLFLDSPAIEPMLKNASLIALEKLYDKNPDLGTKISARMKKGIAVNVKNDYFNDILLRGLLIIKLVDNKKVKYEKFDTKQLANNLAANLNQDRLELLFKLLKQQCYSIG